MSVSVDILAPQKSHIDLSDNMLPREFGMEDYKLCNLFDDVILLEYADLVDGGDGTGHVKRGSLFIPVSQVNNMWRKGRVILKGPHVKYTNVGDIVVFPNNMGIPIANLEVENHGKIKEGLFLNEQRMFGICKPIVNEEG